MQRFDDPASAVRVAMGETFAVALKGNPTTGYTWHASVDARYLELVAQEFEPAGEGVGAGGHEVCRFRTLQAGETQITFVYRRPWDTEARDKRLFQVVIE